MKKVLFDFRRTQRVAYVYLMYLIIYKYYLLARRDIDAAESKTSDAIGVDYSYNNITKTQTVDNTYDASGNLTQVGTSLGAHDLRDITWDAENRIKQISDYAGIHNNSTTQVSSYYYNDSGDRVKKIEDSATTIYPNQYESVRTETGVDTVKTKNIYVGNQRIASILTVGSSTAATYFYITDHLGSTGYLADASGNIAEHIEYTPWGESWWEKTAASPLPGYKFTGKEKDITELYYYGARYYDPRTSVWQSPDPILEKYLDADGNDSAGIFDSRNLSVYSYSGLNPLRYLDPDGNYFREAAVAYSNQWVNSRNPFYAMSKGYYNDCANYVSQSLNAGGIATRTDWFNGPGEFKWNGNKENACYSPSWTTAQGLANWLRGDSGILAGEFRITPETTQDEINNAISGGSVAKGDLLGWSHNENGEDIHHFGIVSDIKDGQIHFNEHTRDRGDKPLTFGPDDKSITVFHIKEDAR